MKVRVLFVCVENSCRSQMAEGFARHYGSTRLDAHSAGSRPSGKVNATAVALMKEKGVDISAQKSKGLDDLPPGIWDLVITMGCGDACPNLPAMNRLDWNLPDPKGLPLEEFREVRDRIESTVLGLVRSVEAAEKRV